MVKPLLKVEFKKRQLTTVPFQETRETRLGRRAPQNKGAGKLKQLRSLDDADVEELVSLAFT